MWSPVGSTLLTAEASEDFSRPWVVPSPNTQSNAPRHALRLNLSRGNADKGRWEGSASACWVRVSINDITAERLRMLVWKNLNQVVRFGQTAGKFFVRRKRRVRLKAQQNAKHNTDPRPTAEKPPPMQEQNVTCHAKGHECKIRKLVCDASAQVAASLSATHFAKKTHNQVNFLFLPRPSVSSGSCLSQARASWS